MVKHTRRHYCYVSVVGLLFQTAIPSSWCFLFPTTTGISSCRLSDYTLSKSNTIVLRSSLSDRGWDNDNFLDALSRGESAVEEANASYQKQSQARAMTRDRLFQNHYGSITSGDDSEIKTSQQGESQQVIESSIQQDVTSNTNVNSDPILAYQMQLQVWQAQMNAYVQVCQASPQAATFLQPPPMPSMSMNGSSAPVMSSSPSSPVLTTSPSDPSILIPPKDVDPSKLNPADYIPKAKNNRDAYEVSNPADVYFAQLKRDSTVRSIARRNGDLETANAPFADAGVKALNGYLSPELIQKRREQLAQNGGEFETSRDEMILPFLQGEEMVDKSYSGVSYRQKLEERKRNKRT